MADLSRFDRKKIRITDKDGSVFTGWAEVCGPGFGLHEFGRAEESIRIGNTRVFFSDIRSVELLSGGRPAPIAAGQFDGLMGELLEGAYFIVDILPRQVPEDAGIRYFPVERYFLQPDRIRPLRRKFAEILLRLNCYYDMAVSFDSCERWERNPDPESFAGRLSALSGSSFLRAVFEEQRAMIDIDPCDTYMTVYDPSSRLSDTLRALAAAEGLFVWSPQEKGD